MSYEQYRMNAAQIVRVFNSLFSESCRTILSGGFSEPLYKAARRPHDLHEIQYREDFSSSALHEIAHWCLAGSIRRKQDDYGYWYKTDRCKDQQVRFEQVEAKPQGLEWILSVAAGVEFRVSCDNFDIESPDITLFRRWVRQEALAQIETGLLQRTRQFVDALVEISGEIDYMDASHYRGLPK
jgi:elongation factor P hydroxylase